MLQQSVILLALLGTSALGWWLVRRRDGRFRKRTAGTDADRLTADDLGHEPAGRATFVLISSATCSTCHQVRRVLSQVTGDVDGVVSVEIGAEGHMDLVRRLGVLRTPTVLLLDGAGVVRSRTSGPLHPEQARAALADLLTPSSTTTRS